MKPVKFYSTKMDANLAKLQLDAAGVPSTVVGVDFALEGGLFGVRLLVPDEYVEEAMSVSLSPDLEVLQTMARRAIAKA